MEYTTIEDYEANSKDYEDFQKALTEEAVEELYETVEVEMEVTDFEIEVEDTSFGYEYGSISGVHKEESVSGSLTVECVFKNVTEEELVALSKHKPFLEDVKMEPDEKVEIFEVNVFPKRNQIDVVCSFTPKNPISDYF